MFQKGVLKYFKIFISISKKNQYLIHTDAQDLKIAWISNFICEEHMVGGQCTSKFLLQFFVFFRKIHKIQFFCIDVNSHKLPSCNPVTVNVLYCRYMASASAHTTQWVSTVNDARSSTMTCRGRQHAAARRMPANVCRNCVDFPTVLLRWFFGVCRIV